MKKCPFLLHFVECLMGTVCGVSRDGSKASNIYRAAVNYGFDVKAYNMTPEAVKEKATAKCRW